MGQLIVQKYGGTSVADPEKIKNVARRVAASAALGHRLVVVVSAMGKTTDSLVALAHAITPTPDPREMDMVLATGEQVTIGLLAMALHSLGQPACSFTGSQVGMFTDGVHTSARIRRITPFAQNRTAQQMRVRMRPQHCDRLIEHGERRGSIAARKCCARQRHPRQHRFRVQRQRRLGG